jgi:predicted acylesterase/phospholipase RssA
MLDRVRIWEAARATSAATTFFEPITIDGQAFSDGATGANNPVDELWVEASAIFSTGPGWNLEDHLNCFVSIGTGVPSLKAFSDSIKDVAKALVDIATSANGRAEQFQRQHPLLFKTKAAFRFNVIQGLEGIGLDEASRLADIESITDRYVASQSVLEQMEDCVRVLRQHCTS